MNVYLATGHQPQYFSFGTEGGSYIAVESLSSVTGVPGTVIQPGATTTVLQTLSNSTSAVTASNPLFLDGLYHTFQVIATAACTVQLQVSNDTLTGQGVVQPMTLNGTTTATLVGPINPNIVTGMLVVGPGIPAGTTITVSGATVTLSSAATASIANVQCQFFLLNWVNLGSALTTAGAGTTGVADVSAWKYVRANVTANSGSVQIIMGT